MKRTSTKHILLLTALLHLFADVALAGGAVLCVGPDDHAAIEIGHLAPDCEIVQEARPLRTDTALESGTCSDCTDSLLHEEAELAPRRVSDDLDAQPVLAAHVTPVPPVGARGIERPTENRLDKSMTLRAHRSTVLLI